MKVAAIEGRGVGRRELARSSWLGWVASLAIYSLFAAIVFVAHGSAPPLSIDHVAYLRQADDILRLHPNGTYWKSITQIHGYGVALAYVYSLTSSHIVSLKLLLAAMTVLSLLAFELLIELAAMVKWKSILFTLISGLFVTFGASIWGFTDFGASGQRIAMIPITLVAVWFWLSRDDQPTKFVVLPLLVVSSLVHLGAYYVAAVLGLMELWSWSVTRRFRIDAKLFWFVVSIAAAYAVRVALEKANLAFTSNLEGLVFPPSGAKLSSEEAWEIELFAFPWRSMPLPLTTVATIVASYGAIFAVAAAGVIVRCRHGLTALDRAMLVFAGAVVAVSYGPQTLLWIGRQLLPVYPFSLEEVRAINLIMVPSLYFGVRLFDALWESPPAANRRPLAVVAVLLLVLQPLLLLRLLPDKVKEDMIEVAVTAGLIRRDDSLRLLYARQILGLDQAGARFYYSTLGLLDWLRRNAARDTRVLATLNELLLVDVEAIGTFNGLLGKAVAAPERKRWAQSVAEVSEAISSRDVDRVRAVARRYGADLAVVPWPVADSLYRDEYYSVIRVET